MSDRRPVPDWLRLDNAAKIYPPAYSDHAPEVFRVGVTLASPVKLGPLERALERTIKRCAYYQVNLRRGLFWYYLQRHQTPPAIELLETAPVSRIRMRSPTAHLFRVFARDRRVQIDFSHVLTDGAGAFTFLSTLIAEYLRQQGVPVPAGGSILDPDEEPDSGEFTDSYPELYLPGMPKPERQSLAYHIPGRVIRGFHRTMTGRMPVSALLEVARRYKVSLTEYLAAVYIHSIYSIWREAEQHPRSRQVIRLEVPADMRRINPSNTMRNFSLFVAPAIDVRLGEYSFEDIVRTVHHMMHLQLDLHEIRKQISRNVGGENLAIVRVIPLLFKDWYLSSLHHKLGGNISSGVISNLGNIVYPDEMMSHISDISFVLGPNPTLRKAISILGYQGNLNITIGSVIQSRELERLFFTSLTGAGVPVRISEHQT